MFHLNFSVKELVCVCIPENFYNRCFTQTTELRVFFISNTVRIDGKQLPFPPYSTNAKRCTGIKNASI